MLKATITAALFGAAFAFAGTAHAQGTITPPASATGQVGAPGSTNSNGVAGTVAGQDNLRGNVRSAPNAAVGSDKSPVSGSNTQSDAHGSSSTAETHPSGSAAQSTAQGSETNNGSSAQSSVASNTSEKAFDPSSLNLGKTSTPIKGMKNKGRVEANERRITAELNRAAADASRNPG